MKIIKTEIIKTEIEIDLPAFTTNNICYWHKVYSPEKCLTVFIGCNLEADIMINFSSLALGESKIACSKEIFEEKFKEAMEILINKKNL